MTAVPATAQFELRNSIEEVARLHDFVEDLGQRFSLPPKAVFDLDLCLEEAVTNIISYAFKSPGDHRIGVSVAWNGMELTIEVIDDGESFDPLSKSDPDIAAPLEEREIGGLGIHLIKKLMDRVEYRRQTNQNVLTLTKRCAPGQPASPASSTSTSSVQLRP